MMFQTPDKEKEISIESCDECGCLIKTGDAQKVTGTYTVFYCGKCRKPYNRHLMWCGVDAVDRFFGEVEMTKDGTPIGYTKKKDN
jgi:hypothetical protein